MSENKLLAYLSIILIIIISIIAILIISMIDFSKKEEISTVVIKNDIQNRNIDTSSIKEDNQEIQNYNESYSEEITESTEEIFSNLLENSSITYLTYERLEEIMKEIRLEKSSYQLNQNKDGIVTELVGKFTFENEEEMEKFVKKFEGTIVYNSISIIGETIYIHYR